MDDRSDDAETRPENAEPHVQPVPRVQPVQQVRPVQVTEAEALEAAALLERIVEHRGAIAALPEPVPSSFDGSRARLEADQR